MLQNPDQEPKYRILDDEDYLLALINKINEESEELQSAPADEAAKELADVYEVILNIAEYLGVTMEEVQSLADEKRARVGAFAKRAFIEHNSVKEDSEWVAKYRKQEDKYPEID